jgi:hypothetical protein
MDQQKPADDNFILAIGVLISAAIGIITGEIILQIIGIIMMIFSMFEVGIIAISCNKHEY